MTSRVRLGAVIGAVTVVVVLMASVPMSGAVLTSPPVQFGARTGKTVAALQSYEARVQHRVSDTRLYYLWDQPFPDATANWAKDNGRTVFMSVFAKRVNGAAVPWRDIASAQPGSAVYVQMQTWADRLKAFGVPVYFSFNHEPEAAKSGGLGSTLDYQAAWQKVITVFREAGVSNAQYVFIGTAFGYANGRPQKYYPVTPTSTRSASTATTGTRVAPVVPTHGSRCSRSWTG